MLVGTGGEVRLDAGSNGNVKIAGNVNSANAYYDGGDGEKVVSTEDGDGALRHGEDLVDLLQKGILLKLQGFFVFLGLKIKAHGADGSFILCPFKKFICYGIDVPHMMIGVLDKVVDIFFLTIKFLESFKTEFLSGLIVRIILEVKLFPFPPEEMLIHLFLRKGIDEIGRGDGPAGEICRLGFCLIHIGQRCHMKLVFFVLSGSQSLLQLLVDTASLPIIHMLPDIGDVQ